MQEIHARIRATYAAQNVALAAFWPFFGRWSAQSQYGYVLEWADSKESAETIALNYYSPRMNLIDQ